MIPKNLENALDITMRDFFEKVEEICMAHEQDSLKQMVIVFKITAQLKHLAKYAKNTVLEDILNSPCYKNDSDDKKIINDINKMYDDLVGE